MLLRRSTSNYYQNLLIVNKQFQFEVHVNYTSLFNKNQVFICKL